MAPPRRRGRDGGPPRSAPASPGRVQRAGTGWGTAGRPFGARVRPFVGSCALSRRSCSRRNSSRRSRSSHSSRSCTRCSRSSSRRGCCAAGRSTDRGTRRRSRAGRCSRARRPPRSPRARPRGGRPRASSPGCGGWSVGGCSVRTRVRCHARSVSCTRRRWARRASRSGPAKSTVGRVAARVATWARARPRVASTPAPVASTGFQRPARRSSSRSSERVEEVGEATEGGARDGQRRGVVRPPGEDRGVREGRRHGVGGRGRGLLERRRPAALDRVLARRDREQRRRVEARGCGGARPVAPAVGQPAARPPRPARCRKAPWRSSAWSATWPAASSSAACAASRAPSPVATVAVRIPRAGQGPATAVAAVVVRGPGLRRGEHRDEQGVDVGRGPRELAVIVAQGEAGAAQVRRPAAVQRGGAGGDDRAARCRARGNGSARDDVDHDGRSPPGRRPFVAMGSIDRVSPVGRQGTVPGTAPRPDGAGVQTTIGENA